MYLSTVYRLNGYSLSSAKHLVFKGSGPGGNQLLCVTVTTLCFSVSLAAANRGNATGSSQTGDALGKALASVSYKLGIQSISPYIPNGTELKQIWIKKQKHGCHLLWMLMENSFAI